MKEKNDTALAMMLVSVLCILLISAPMIVSITPVPGTIHVHLQTENQVFHRTYLPGATVHYRVQLENIPIDDHVHIGVEIRGSNPNGGPRGYIATARTSTSVKNFLRETSEGLQFNLSPIDVYAGYSWFLRPHVFYLNESFVSTNMMNSGASELFQVLKK